MRFHNMLACAVHPSMELCICTTRRRARACGCWDFIAMNARKRRKIQSFVRERRAGGHGVAAGCRCDASQDTVLKRKLGWTSHRKPVIMTGALCWQRVVQCSRNPCVYFDWHGSNEPPFRHYFDHPNGAVLMVKPTTAGIVVRRFLLFAAKPEAGTRARGRSYMI